MDDFTNGAEFIVQGVYDAAAVNINLSADPGVFCPAAPANGWWWNATDYPAWKDDPKREIVRMTARAGAALTIARGQEIGKGGLAASTKNEAAKVYKITFGPTAKTFNVDIPAAVAAAVATPSTVAAGGANHRTRGGVLELFNAEQNLWFPVTLIGGAGAEQIRIGDGNNNP